MNEGSLTRLDFEIGKLEARLSRKDKMSGLDFARENLAVVQALRLCLRDALARIEKLENMPSR